MYSVYFCMYYFVEKITSLICEKKKTRFDQADFWNSCAKGFERLFDIFHILSIRFNIKEPIYIRSYAWDYSVNIYTKRIKRVLTVVKQMQHTLLKGWTAFGNKLMLNAKSLYLLCKAIFVIRWFCAHIRC